MRLYLNKKEVGTLIGALIQCYSTADVDTRAEIDTLLERIDVCVELQGKDKADKRDNDTRK